MEKIWLKSYPKDVSDNVNLEQFSSLIEVFESSANLFHDLIAYENMNHGLTYKEVFEKASAFASYLKNDLGLEKGSRVAIMMPNLLQYPIAFFGVLMAEMVVVNVNPLYTPRELKHQLVDSGAQAIVILANFADVLEQIIQDTQIKQVVVTHVGDLLSPVKKVIVNFVVKYIKKMVPNVSFVNGISLLLTIEKGQSHSFEVPTLTKDTLAVLQYTGGTTGVAKGAMLTHGNLLANLLQIKHYVGPLLEEKKEVVITALPMYHIFALTVNCLLFFSIGAKNILITNPREMNTFIKTIKTAQFTVIVGVNTLFNGLLNNPHFKSVDFSRIKMGLGGGMAVQKAVAEKWEAVTGNRLLEGYGLTECSPVVSFAPYTLEKYNGTIGLPIPMTDVKLINEQGESVGLNEEGELCIKGPQVMQAYWNNEEDTKNIFIDGWLKTGDICTINEQGFISVVDRKKDMILVSGFNVYPNEIENVIMMYDGVLEAAAVGEKNDEKGEIVKVFIVKKYPNITEKQIIEHCKKFLTAYKIPKKIVFKDSLPKTNIGKILRRELR